MMLLATLAETWNNLWGPINDFVVNNEFMGNISGYLNTGLVSGGILFYYKFVAPRLARAKFINSQFDEILKVLNSVDEKIKVKTGIDLNLDEGLMTLREAFGLAFKNSNLDNHTKAMLEEVLKGVTTGNEINLKDNLEELSEDAQQAAAELRNKAVEVVEDRKKSALAILDLKVKEAENMLKCETLPPVEPIIVEESQEE